MDKPRPQYNRPPSFTKSGVFDQAVNADAILELGDGSIFRGIGFGTEGKSVAGECVFQTGELAFEFGFIKTMT